MSTIGIIGLGGMGLRRLEYLAGMDGVRIGGLCTRGADVLAEQAARFDVPLASPDWRDLLAADLDAVVVCTPNGSHAEIATAALRAGKDVLVEYPMAVTLEEIDTLLGAASETGRLLHVGHTMRHEAQHVAVRDRLAELGEPIEYRGVMALPEMWKWTGDPAVCGSFFALANYHLADQVVDWFGRPTWVNGSMWRREAGGVVEGISGSMFFGNDRGFSAHVNYTMGVPCQETIVQWELIGSQRRVIWREDALTFQSQDGSMETVEIGEQRSWQADTDRFVGELRGEAAPVSLDDDVAATRVCLLAEQSAREGNVTLRM